VRTWQSHVRTWQSHAVQYIKVEGDILHVSYNITWQYNSGFDFLVILINKYYQTNSTRAIKEEPCFCFPRRRTPPCRCSQPIQTKHDTWVLPPPCGVSWCAPNVDGPPPRPRGRAACVVLSQTISR